MIEDVAFLNDNCDKDSIVIYADSTLRNKIYYPHPSEYVIEFEQPFKLVYGFDILDASIPTTMYNIDVYNNGIYFTGVSKNLSAFTIVDMEAMFKDVVFSNVFIKLFEDSVESFIIMGNESYLSSFITGTTGLSDYHWVFLKYTMTNIPIELKKLQILENYFVFTFNGNDYILSKDHTDIYDIIQDGNFNIVKTVNNTYDLIYFVPHKISTTAYNTIKNTGLYIVLISNYRRKVPVGNYDVLTITNDLNELLNQVLVNAEPTSSPPAKEGKMMFTSGNFFLLDGEHSTILKSLGFDTYPTATASANMYSGYIIGPNPYVFGSIFDSDLSTYKIVSPGLVNLLGERYVKLRIKELEDHLYGSYSYVSYTPGIGMFKMAASSGGVTNLRFDFVNLVRKPFHPLGKLSKLTLRFETASGHLYDFKGVNHNIIFVVKFFVPTQKITFQRSILNPNYNPNFMDYMSQNKSIEYKEDSDDEEDFDDEDNYKTYKQELDKYDYSSEEDDDDT